MSKQQHQQSQLCGHTAASKLAALCPYNSSITGSSVPILQPEQWHICAQNSITTAGLCPKYQHQQWHITAKCNCIISGSSAPNTTSSTVAELSPNKHQQWQMYAQQNNLHCAYPWQQSHHQSQSQSQHLHTHNNSNSNSVCKAIQLQQQQQHS